MADPTTQADIWGTVPIIADAIRDSGVVRFNYIVIDDHGRLSALKGPLQEFLQKQGGLEAIVASTELCDSLLATAEGSMGLDWTARIPLQAAMKVALRRTLIKFGIEAKRAEQTAEGLVAWLKTNAPALTETTPAA